jgi:hypothetical protein
MPDFALGIGDEIATNGEEKFILPRNLWICGKYQAFTIFLLFEPLVRQF